MSFGKKFNDGSLAEATRNAHEEITSGSGAQLAQEFLLVHAVFKSFMTIDEDYGDFIIIKATDFGVGVDVDFTPGEAAALVELDDALFDYLAEMTSLAGIDNNFPRLRHAGSVAVLVEAFQPAECQARQRRIS
jgi:hypothetical protein